PPAYLDFTFLGVVESLALYYTRRADGIAHRSRENDRLTEILHQLPTPDADWIRNHIWVRPFPPLQDILVNLVREHTNAINPLVRTEDAFITEVMNTVNYFLRRDPEV